MSSRLCRKQGFTLIELSIVLVIIGLIVGGVLVGQDLIEAARIRAQLSQLDQIYAASKTFQLKYNGMAGDLTEERVLTFGFPDRYGNGNGIIEGQNYLTFTREIVTEPVYFFAHLQLAGLFNDTLMMDGGSPLQCFAEGGGVPALKLNGNGGMVAAGIGSVNYLFLGITGQINAGLGGSGCNWFGGSSPNDITPNGVITPNQAFAIDSKTDDGRPNTGTVIATQLGGLGGTCPSACLDGTIDNNALQCVTDASATVYNVNNDMKWCRLLIRMP